MHGDCLIDTRDGHGEKGRDRDDREKERENEKREATKITKENQKKGN